MDPTCYAQLATKRGLNYEYFYSSAWPNRPTLFFLHGFPSQSREWYRQIEYFKPLGYGILAPDMLGAGRTSRPLDSKDWRLNLIAADLVDILEAVKLEQVIGIGHDWGCAALSRLSILFPERFLGFVWLGLSFLEPITEKFELDAVMAITKEYLGYEGYSYWKFFEQQGSAKTIQDHVDSFIQLLYPKDPSTWLTYMALPGKTAEWIENDMKPGFPDYLTMEDIENIRRNVLDSGGIKSSLNWYISQIENNDLEDNLSIPKERWWIQSPSLFIAASQDYICTPKRGKDVMTKYASEVKIVDVDTGHWVHLEASNKVNAEIEQWLNELQDSEDS
ncbi:epoxide hydrolase [Moniliophthora roreri MCA 2997]|uniref:Epoxide hydrolase n=2 Tax=Moniliophthora roreri TaxID=221103 RepID=V2YS20_MONRO|nr:epoxide hydrolase [Moniliophthora roreri MCA 2997]KAI3612330.1 epoxide hydrolase [Moniliophthora roreri]